LRESDGSGQALWVSRGVGTGKVFPQVDVFYGNSATCNSTGTFIMDEATPGSTIGNHDQVFRIPSGKRYVLNLVTQSVRHPDGGCDAITGSRIGIDVDVSSVPATLDGPLVVTPAPEG
jgi:hypothetical protein